MKKMLLSFAHPDDESFFCGGTVAKYADTGWVVDALSATRGEVGEAGPFAPLTKEALGARRQKELEAAAAELGIHSVSFLGLIDGTLKENPPGDLEEEIFQKMVELIPDVVITFDTTGLTNHSDHIRMSYATTFAFQKYAKWISESLSGTVDYTEDAAPKLYYVSVPQSLVRFLVAKKVMHGESFGKPVLGAADDTITAVVNIKKFAPRKRAALVAHATQEKDVQRFLSYPKHPLFSQEYFVLRMHGTRETFMGKNDRVTSKL